MDSSEMGLDPEDFTHRTNAFLQWFSRSHRTRLSQKIQLADLTRRNAGRGVVALQDIAEDEELFSIPKPLVLTAANSDVPKEILEAIGSENAWLPLIVALIYEILREKSSPWYPYLSILPQAFHTLMFWSDEEVAELQASAVIGKIGKAQTEEAWSESIIPVMLEHSETFSLTQQDEKSKVEELRRLAHRAGSLIMAYAFDIDREEDTAEAPHDNSDGSGLVVDEEDTPLKGMVPFADMLNADAEKNNARLFQEDDSFVMKSIKAIQSGEEIFNDYGPLPRSDLLRMYGYFTDNYAKYDVVEVSYGLVVAAAKETMPQLDGAYWLRLEDSAEEYDLLEEGYTISRPMTGTKLEENTTGQLHMLLRLLCGGPCKRRDWSDDDAIPKFPFTPEETQLLVAVVQRKLGQYSTDLAQDRAFLQSTQHEWSVTRAHRIRMAIQIRIGEKEICHAISEMCRNSIQLATPVSSRQVNGTTKRSGDEDQNGAKMSRKASRKG